MRLDEWVEYGIEKGFASYLFDWVQSGPELSDQELDELENGDNPVITCLRIYRSQL